MQPSNIFGKRGWNDVRDVVTARIWKRFGRVKSDDVEDAVSLAMVDLVDYWLDAPTSVIPDNPDRTFWQACKRGTWMATVFLTQDWDAKDVPSEFRDSGTEGTLASVSLPALPPPEDEVLDRLEREGFNAFLSDHFDEFKDWLQPFLSGVSLREQARAEGVSHVAVSQRWSERMTRFVRAAEAAGLAS